MWCNRNNDLSKWLFFKHRNFWHTYCLLRFSKISKCLRYFSHILSYNVISFDVISCQPFRLFRNSGFFMATATIEILVWPFLSRSIFLLHNKTSLLKLRSCRIFNTFLIVNWELIEKQSLFFKNLKLVLAQWRWCFYCIFLLTQIDLTFWERGMPIDNLIRIGLNRADLN